MYSITPLLFSVLLTLTSATFHEDQQKPSLFIFHDENKEMMQANKAEKSISGKLPETKARKKVLNLLENEHKIEHGNWREHNLMHSHDGLPPVVEGELTAKRKYAPKLKSWKKLVLAPKVVIINKPFWEAKPKNSELITPATTVPKEGATTKMAPAEASAEITEGPAEITEGPAEITEGPAEITEGPAEITEGPAEITEGPAEITEGPAGIIDDPAKITEGPTEVNEAPVDVTEMPANAPNEIPTETTKKPHPILPTASTMKYVLNHEAAEKYWATANFPTTTPAAAREYITEVPLLTESEDVTERPKTAIGYEEPQPSEVPQVEPMNKQEVFSERLFMKSKTPKYVLNEEAARKYWATANFLKATSAYSHEPTTKPPLLSKEDESVKEQLKTARYEESKPDLASEVEPVPKPAAEKPNEEVASMLQNTQKYILNEKAAEKYWATASFATTTASAVKAMMESSESSNDILVKEQHTNLPVEAVLEGESAEEIPAEVASTSTTEYVLNKEAAADYWATAKFETTAAPSVPLTETPASEEISQDKPTTISRPKPIAEEKPVEDLPVAKEEQLENKPEVEKSIEKLSRPTIPGGKGIVIEKKEHKKYWIHKPFGHPKDIRHWQLTKPLKPCKQKLAGKLVDCQPEN